MTSQPARVPNGLRVLDLCSGAGGLSWGYWLAGFDVVGVDKYPMPNYPFTFHQADALDYLANITASGEIEKYALVHASWPCPRYANVTQWRGNPDDHPDLLPSGREALQATGVPWVMENVPEAPLRPDYLLCGSQFGINVRRHRSFETSWHGGGELLPPCWHHKGLLPFMHKGERAYADAMGCTWMNKTEARQAVPPAYSEWIGRQFLANQLDQAA